MAAIACRLSSNKPRPIPYPRAYSMTPIGPKIPPAGAVVACKAQNDTIPCRDMTRDWVVAERYIAFARPSPAKTLANPTHDLMFFVSHCPAKIGFAAIRFPPIRLAVGQFI